MMKPTPTTCIATSDEMPKIEHAMGINSREPPATPDAPQAATEARMESMKARTSVISTPIVCAAAIVMTVMVTAAPSMLMVAPSGIDTE